MAQTRYIKISTNYVQTHHDVVTKQGRIERSPELQEHWRLNQTYILVG